MMPAEELDDEELARELERTRRMIDDGDLADDLTLRFAELDYEAERRRQLSLARAI